MRESVRAAFVPFTAPLEGVLRFMYLDVKGLVTCAIGNLIDPVSEAVGLPFHWPGGAPATPSEIAAEWQSVKARTDLMMHGGGAFANATTLRLTDEGVATIVGRKLAQMDRYLVGRFPDYPDWPADAQLAVLSQSWACGPAFHFPKLEAALRAQDFDACIVYCTINETGNPGVRPRNVANRLLYRNATHVQGMHLDPDALIWPSTIDPALPAATGEEVTGSGPIIHPLPTDNDEGEQS